MDAFTDLRFLLHSILSYQCYYHNTKITKPPEGGLFPQEHQAKLDGQGGSCGFILWHYRDNYNALAHTGFLRRFASLPYPISLGIFK